MEVSFGIKLVRRGCRQQLELFSKQIKHESFAVVILGQRRGGICRRVLDGKTVPGVAGDVADVQAPTHAAPVKAAAGRIIQRQIWLGTISSRSAGNGNGIGKTAGEQVNLVFGAFAGQILRLILLVAGAARRQRGHGLSKGVDCCEQNRHTQKSFYDIHNFDWFWVIGLGFGCTKAG